MTRLLPERLARWLAPPGLPDDIDRRNAAAIQTAALLGVVYLTINNILRLGDWYAGRLQSGDFVNLATDTALLVALLHGVRRIRAGDLRQAMVLILTTWVATDVCGAVWMGLRSTTNFILSFALPPVAAALVLGRAALWRIVVAYALTLFLAHARDFGAFGPPPGEPVTPPLGSAAHSAAILFFLGVVLDRFGLALREALAAARTHQRDVEAEMQRRRETETRLIEAKKMEAIARLSGGVAHDFNNLLTVILGFAELARRHTQHTPADEPLAEITLAASRAADLTRQLLAFSRRQVVEPHLVSLAERISRLEPTLSRLIGETYAIRSEFAAESWPVLIDPGQLEQVLLNLVVNARDAMPDGGTIVLRTHNAASTRPPETDHFEARRGDYVVLEVVDHGGGLDESARSHLFEPFFTTKSGHGTGLGLATSAEIVRGVGGAITVQSQAGATCFSVWLPRAEGTPEPASTPGPVPLARGTETVLLVEDEPAIRQLIGAYLGELGYTVFAAGDADEAIAAARGHEGMLHLLISDVVLPHGNGRVLAETLRQQRPHLRVLLISGYNEDETLRRGVVQEEWNYLPKPFTPERLARRVRDVLEATPGAPTRPAAVRRDP